MPLPGQKEPIVTRTTMEYTVGSRSTKPETSTSVVSSSSSIDLPPLLVLVGVAQLVSPAQTIASALAGNPTVLTYKVGIPTFPAYTVGTGRQLVAQIQASLKHNVTGMVLASLASDVIAKSGTANIEGQVFAGNTTYQSFTANVSATLYSIVNTLAGVGTFYLTCSLFDQSAS